MVRLWSGIKMMGRFVSEQQKFIRNLDFSTFTHYTSYVNHYFIFEALLCWYILIKKRSNIILIDSFELKTTLYHLFGLSFSYTTDIIVNELSWLGF